MFLSNYSHYPYNFVWLLEEFNKPNSFRLIQFYLCIDKTIYSFCVHPVFHHSLLVLPISANPYCSSILPILSIVVMGNFNMKWPTSELLFPGGPSQYVVDWNFMDWEDMDSVHTPCLIYIFHEWYLEKPQVQSAGKENPEWGRNSVMVNLGSDKLTDNELVLWSYNSLH